MNQIAPGMLDFSARHPTTDHYLADIENQLLAMQQQPWDHHQRKIDDDRLRKRLAGERDSLLALIAQGRKVCSVHLLLLADFGPSDHVPTLRAQTRQTLISWGAQSHPLTRLTLVAPADSGLHGLADSMSDNSVTDSLDENWWQQPLSDELLILATPGDLFHPALATCLALQEAHQTSTNGQPSIAWSWNRIIGSTSTMSRYSADYYLRSPGASPMTLLGADYVGGAIAWRFDWLAQREADIRLAFAAGNYQPALLCLAAIGADNWHHYPEYLSISRNAPIRDYGNDPHSMIGTISRLAASLHWEEWRQSTTHANQPVIEPVSQVNGISVVIPFRDHPENTLKCVQAIAGQSASTWIEVVLVNNASTESNLEQLKTGLDSLQSDCVVTVIDYLEGFSHSRQCNLGVAHCRGEVVVILNNDAYLHSTDCLDQIARWAQIPGVATVGAQITDTQGNVICAGLRARLRTGFDFEAGFEESTDPIMQDMIREVFGNTGACFGIMKERFVALGGFDEILYPIGFNDVEFCLRAREQGLKHINLGWLIVEHQPGTSRGHSDEIMQKISMRSRFPGIGRDAQFQLGLDPHFKTMVTGKTRPANVPTASRSTGIDRVKKWILRATTR